MSSKRYKCPYCENRLERAKLINHVDKSHQDIIPEGFSATRVVYNSVNKTNGGRCRVCGKPTDWREDTGRYDVLCKDPKCKQKMRDDYKKNMLRVRGTYNILNDPEQQTKMLANRSISAEYQFTDGGKVGYTGTYERKCLEFMDVVMQIKSEDIISPGPIMEYIYNGEKHIYIPDFYYVPYNLIIEVKDGGDNKNTKESPGMRSSRERTIEKERMITDKGVYNYIRLTDNNFQQLIEIFMEIKLALIEGDPKKTVKVNESSIMESTKSSVDHNYKPKGKINLSSLKMVHITDSVISKYKKEYPFLKHVRCKDTKEYICDGYIWFDKDELAAMVGSCEYTDDKTKWIVSLEIPKNYKGYGLSKQILDYATKTMKCKYLSVNKNNKLAKKIYDDYGFKVYQESNAMYYMTIDANAKINESAISEFVLQKVNKSVRLFHGSPIQGLKYLEPRQESINTNVGEKKLVYATDDIRFAACFGGIWHDDIAKQGTWDGWNTITMGMSNKVDLTKPCSIYELENDGSFIQIATKEMVSSQKIKIKREIRYNSYLEALRDNGVEIISLDEYHKRLAKSKQSKYETGLLEGSPLIDRYVLDLNGTPDKPTINGVAIEWDEIDRYCPINISNIPNCMGINLCSVHSIEWSRLQDGQLIDVMVKFVPWESETGVVESAVVKDNSLLKESKLNNSQMLNESGRMTPEQLDAFYTELKKRLAENDEDFLSEVAFINDNGEEVPKKCPKCGGDVKLYLRGEPVFLCVNCEEYFGTVPFKNEAVIKESAFGRRKVDYIRHDMPISDITDDHLKSAFDKVIHMVKWCSMESFAFCNVKEFSAPRKVSDTSFIAGIITNERSAEEVVRVLNNNNSFFYGTFEASSRAGEKYLELFINVVELHYYEKVSSPEALTESTNVDLTKFTYYHAELARKGWNPKTRAGGWDEELYSKNIDFAVHNDIEPQMRDKDKAEAHLFTMGEDYSAIYLGIITVYKTSDGKIDWEWSEQEDISQEYADYIREEIQEQYCC